MRLAPCQVKPSLHPDSLRARLAALYRSKVLPSIADHSPSRSNMDSVSFHLSIWWAARADSRLSSSCMKRAWVCVALASQEKGSTRRKCHSFKREAARSLYCTSESFEGYHVESAPCKVWDSLLCAVGARHSSTTKRASRRQECLP